MAKQQKEELPLMEDFTEESLFDQLEEEDDDKAKGSGDNEHDDDDDDDDEAATKAKAKKDQDDDSDDDDDDDSEDDDSETAKAKKSKSKKDKESDDDDEDDDESDDDDSDASKETFWSDVEKLTGRTVEVDYGKIDPESPEGAAKREEALVQSAINDHLDYLAKIYPREFRALEHAANGGQMEDLYNPSEPDFSKISIEKDDTARQKTFLQGYYERKGLSAAKSTKMVESDEDSDEGLHTATTDALKELTTAQEKDRVKIADSQKKVNDQNRQEDMQMIGDVEKVVQTGKLVKFTVPVKEREKFHQFALQHIQRNPNGGYMFVQPVNPRGLEQQLQELYFTYKGGDLSSIIQREVKTEGVRKLKRSAEKSSSKKAGASDGDSRQDRKGALPTMDDYTV